MTKFNQVLVLKDDHDIPLGAKKEAVGPAVMMEPFFKRKVDGKSRGMSFICGRRGRI